MPRAAVLEVTSEEWRAQALEFIENHPIGTEFHADKLRGLIAEPPKSTDWAGLFSAAKAAGLVIHVGWRRSTYPARRHGTQAVWQRVERKHRD
ncbi:hypothetical protein [Sinomonas susongensis]|uniref:hypothetical protein n=1 Tax=Sinomonas susongensis TaxID=1324851 RepID=UPI00110830AF|nr:hypothetical protein [Sinomonas susongensis]